jgi:hypothetical protein
MKVTVTLLVGAAVAISAALGLDVGVASAQDVAGGLAGVRRTVARREANLLRVDGVPTVLTWARGVRRPADLDQYAALGLNTAYFELSSVATEELERLSSLASAAEERGLLVIVALAPPPLFDEGGATLAIDPLSDAYVEAVQAYVAAAVEGVGEHPRLIGWSVEAVPASQVVNNDRGFVSYLRSWYESLNALNQSWGSEYGEWRGITLAGARDIDSGLPQGIGRASVDYAYYREAAYADSLSLWAAALREAVPGRLVLAAGAGDYRSIASVRRDFDGIVVTAYPGSGEPDWRTHNVHAVDIARRANMFAAVQVLQVGSETSSSQVAGWAGLALAHGATGVAFSSWGAVKDSPDLRAAVSQVADMVQAAAYPVTPMARTAVIYEPLAGGVMNRGRALYGYLDGVTPNSPTDLFVIGRMGSSFGLLDILRWDILGDVDLSQYGTIIAPMVFYLPDEAQMALHNFVLTGGALVVDAGVGMYQAEGTITSMPMILRGTLNLRYSDAVGVSPTEEFEQTVDYGEVYDPAAPTERTPLAPGQEGKDFDPALTRFIQALEEFATRGDVAEFLGQDFLGEAGEAFRVSGLGKGFAVYTPEFLYESWRAGDPSFNEFHRRLLSWGSELEVVQPGGVWPGVTATLYHNWSVGVASPESLTTSVLVGGAGNQVYLIPGGAMRLANAADEDRVELLFPGGPLAQAVPVPVFVYPLAQGGVVTLSVAEYGRDGIELVIHGSGAGVGVREGEINIRGGEQTLVGIEVRGGPLALSPDSMYRVTIRQGAGGGRQRHWDVMPDPDTGSLLIQETIYQARIRIEPILQ